MLSLKKFGCAICEVLKDQYLKHLIKANFHHQFVTNVAKGFPHMFASLNCMHYKWENYHTTWKSQSITKIFTNSIIFEAIVDKSLWIWQCFFGLPSGNNDLNVG
jgi:hypothetical protein